MRKGYDKLPEVFVERDARVSLREDGGLCLAIVADTHGRPHPHTAEQLQKLAPDAIVHAGDIGDLSVLDDLAQVAPVIAVRGNIDARTSDLPDVVNLDVYAGDERALRILLTHIAVGGPRLRADVARIASERGAQVVLCGHSHVPFLGKDRGMLVFNPGSIGPRRLRLPIVFGVMEVKGGKLSLRHVDAETGADWAP